MGPRSSSSLLTQSVVGLKPMTGTGSVAQISLEHGLLTTYGCVQHQPVCLLGRALL